MNSYDDVLYFHDESLNLALHLIWSVLYFEQNMTGKLYGYRSKLNLIQQAKRWQSKREQSHYLYVEFTQAIGR